MRGLALTMSGCWSEMGCSRASFRRSAQGGVFATLPPSAKRVALSLSPDPTEVARVIEQTRPDIIHIGAAVELLSVRDTQALKAAFPDVLIMRAIPVVDETSVECARGYRKAADILLLDSHDPGDRQIGGLGRVHDWSISRRIAEEVGLPVILAGGLDADNVAAAIAAVRPAVSTRRPRPTGKTAAAKISTR